MGRMRLLFTLITIPAAAVPALVHAQRLAEVRVSVSGPTRTIASALTQVRAGGRIVVEAGTYREPTIRVSQPVEIVGVGRPVLDGEGVHEILLVTADSVTVRGFRFVHVNTSYVEDLAAIRVVEARGCTIADNEFTDVFFGVYLAKVSGCRIERNRLHAANRSETTSGNGIHLWSTRDVQIIGNTITGFRDGLYFEFVHDAVVQHNVSERNIRYGLHFMYSDDCRYEGNTFSRNGSGVAVMYTHRVTMIANRFEHNWGAAAYGLLLKEISDARIERNTFLGNTTGLVADGANRMQARSNDFLDNGWALRLNASTVGGEVSRNNFSGNTFDVASNSQDVSTVISGNYWDAYRGYDLNRDGVGDVPFHPVRVFSMLVERTEPALILLRSAFVTLIDATERVLPVITPRLLVDANPSMRRLR
jgi:nitrous oxidase accessory protein